MFGPAQFPNAQALLPTPDPFQLPFLLPALLFLPLLPGQLLDWVNMTGEDL